MEFKDKFKKYEKEAFSMLEDVISYPSVLDEYIENGDAPFGKATKECLEYVLNKASKDGFLTYNAKNYAGHIEYGNGKETLGILAHLDVVPVDEKEWVSNPFKLAIRDGKMYARGVEDDKGPFVASYIALKMLKDEGFKPSRRIRLIFGCDEESGSRCLEKYFTLMPQPDIAFSPDAEFPVINGEKGMMSYDINVSDNVITYFKSGTRYNIVPSYAKMKINIDLKIEFINYLKENNYDGSIDGDIYQVNGIAAHAMCPEKGLNAAYILFDFLSKYSNSKLAKFVKSYYLFDVYGKLAGYSDFDDEMKELTSNFAVVDINDYKGKIGINCRCPKDSDFELIRNSVTNICKDYNYEYIELFSSNRHYIDKNSELVTKLMESYVKVTNDTANKPFSIGGGTYARECKYAVAFGPQFPGREDVCHIANEYMYVDDFIKIIEIYYEAIYNLAK